MKIDTERNVVSEGSITAAMEKSTDKTVDIESWTHRKILTPDLIDLHVGSDSKH